VTYNDNVLDNIAILNISTGVDLGYILTNAESKCEVISAIVSSITLNTDIDINDIIDTSKIHTLYHKLISIFLQSISNSLLTDYVFQPVIDLKYGNQLV
jgi:hypothetical protein